jgi:hypothetical protein
LGFKNLCPGKILNETIEETILEKNMMRYTYLLSIFIFFQAISVGQNLISKTRVRGWTILSNSKEDGLTVIAKAREYDINQLQLSHDVIMDLREIRNPSKLMLVREFTEAAHKTGIPEVVLWDHALYNLNYYPDEFKTGPKGTIDLDNPEFWKWFKQDYRAMLNLIPDIQGLVLTFIETGAHVEDQYAQILKTNAEKLAAVVNAVADVVIKERKLKLYIRTFSYTQKEYNTVIGSISHLNNPNIILMMKETPHDFFLTHPDDLYAGTINRPTIIEFDCGNEFSGQNIIANTWPEYIIHRWSDFLRRPNIMGYSARTDRYGDTRIIGHPAEILVYTLKRYGEDTTLTTSAILDEFISKQYGAKALPFLKPAFSKAYDIISSTLYTLGINIAFHSALNFDSYEPSYGRHVPGRWITPPVTYIGHDVNRSFHYWKDIIQHLAPARYKKPTGSIRQETPVAIDSGWISPVELMDTVYLNYIITEKAYAVKQAEEALTLIEKSRPYLTSEAYNDISQLFNRTLLTAKLYLATARAYWGYRVFARGKEFQTETVRKIITNGLTELKSTAMLIKNYPYKVPKGQWNWRTDADMALKYHELISVSGWKEYGGVTVK